MGNDTELLMSSPITPPQGPFYSDAVTAAVICTKAHRVQNVVLTAVTHCWLCSFHINVFILVSEFLESVTGVACRELDKSK